jgi:hypothetical protein
MDAVQMDAGLEQHRRRIADQTSVFMVEHSGSDVRSADWIRFSFYYGFGTFMTVGTRQEFRRLNHTT